MSVSAQFVDAAIHKSLNMSAQSFDAAINKAFSMIGSHLPFPCPNTNRHYTAEITGISVKPKRIISFILKFDDGNCPLPLRFPIPASVILDTAASRSTSRSTRSSTSYATDGFSYN
jgi:hypothetical protein